jgi:tRNA threonylcarbamoyl adenosine modification protein YjeE
MGAEVAAARLSLRLDDEAATERLAEDVAAVLQAGDLVALSGGLGAGKTTFARALLRSLAADARLEVPSPTFPLRIDHALPRLKVAHADLYRLGGREELDEIGLDEALGEGALLVEWPEALPADLSLNRLDVVLSFEGAGRRAEIGVSGTWPERLARTREVRAFLDRSGWGGAARIPLAGDASYRVHERIRRGAGTAVLMNGPARAPGLAMYDGRSYDEVARRATDIRPFVAIDSALCARGIRAPELHAVDMETGLLLSEDLGGEGIVDPSGAPIMERYEAAVDLLVHMHLQEWPKEAALPDGSAFRVPDYDRGALLVEISLFPDWFGGHGDEPRFPPAERRPFLAAWDKVLDAVDPSLTTWVMRDFHSPNILWQAGAEGIGRVGVIDFQDALFGHPAYDVASLAQDARVPMTEEQEAALRARYLAGRTRSDSGFDAAAFDTAFTILGTQRATKVLGIFTRLALAEGKPGYQRHRKWLKTVIGRNLAHPVLSELRLWYEPYL